MSQSKLETPMPEYFPAFDWLRLALAMIVALAHDGASVDSNMPNFAVQVFFALSGWLIGGILLDSERAKLPRFYFNRATRIWAPYYFSVLLLFAVSLLKEPVDANWLEYLFYDLTYTHNWFITPRIVEIKNDLPLEGTTNHFWSLSVEEQFYLFAPLLILFLRWGRSPILWGIVASLAVLFETLYGAIALGVLAVTLQRQFGDWHLRKEMTVLIVVVLLSICGLYIAKPGYYALLAPFAAVAIVLLCARRGTKTRVGEFVGGISYPLYLNHWIGIFVAHEVAQLLPFIGRNPAIVLGAILNIAIASVLFVVIDEQVRKRRNGWFTQKRGRQAAMVAYGLVLLGGVGGLLIALLRT